MCYHFMHVTCMEPVECTRRDGEAMHASILRESFSWRVRRADGEGSSQVEEPEYESRMEMKVQMEGDAEAQVVGDDEQQQHV
jgi:hypothetical protein